jgi:hypothetical protein
MCILMQWCVWIYMQTHDAIESHSQQVPTKSELKSRIVEIAVDF